MNTLCSCVCTRICNKNFTNIIDKVGERSRWRPFSIATTPRRRGGRYSFPRVGLLALDTYLILLRCPRGVMVKAMNCGILVREFVLQSRYYVHFRANTLGKGMNPLILPPAMGK